MEGDGGATRRIIGLVPIQAIILAIGIRYAVGDGGVPKLIGWTLVAGSLITLIAYGLAIWRAT